jgi:HK97 family phage major capsid protein/HK97 family phage prohead protease
MSDAKSRSRALSFSSEKTVVQRWFGGEILDHSPKAVRMDFMNSGRAPLLMYHDTRQQIGVIEKANIGGDKMGHATARFGRTATAADALDNVDDGILTNTSVGYRVHSMVLDSSKDGEDIYRVTDWEPYEASLVTVPADPLVGVGRGAVLPIDAGPPGTTPEVKPEAGPAPASSSSTPEIQPPATTAARGVTHVTTETTAAAGASAEVKPVNAVDADRERREAISNLCKANGIDSRAEAEWINDPFKWTWRAISDQILSIKEARTKHNPTVDTALGLSRSETQRYSLFRAIRHLKNPASPKFREEARFEIECTEALAKRGNERSSESSILIPSEILVRPMAPEVMGRAMATQPGNKGGYMVNVENMGFLEILRNRSVAMAMGARNLSGLTGNVMFPRQTGKSTVTWQGGEGVSVTATDQTLGQLSMTPKTAIIVTDVSEQLLRQASPSAEQFVMADLAASIAIDGVDAAVIGGTGGAQPLGIKNTTGITSGQDASTATYAKIIAFVTTAGASNAIRGNPGWVTNITGAGVLAQRQRFTSTDTPLWTGNLLNGSVIGFNAMSSEQLASGNIIFGSWDEVVIGDWGVLELSTDNGGTRFNQAQVGIRALWMVDVLLRYPQAFVVGTNLS